MSIERIYEEATPKGRLVVSAYLSSSDEVHLQVELDGKRVADAAPKETPSAGAELTVGRVDFTGARGVAVVAALDGWIAANADEVAEARGRAEADDASEQARWDRIERQERARDEAASIPRGVTGGDADIEADYPGGLAAFRRGEPVDRTPRHKGEIAGY